MSLFLEQLHADGCQPNPKLKRTPFFRNAYVHDRILVLVLELIF